MTTTEPTQNSNLGGLKLLAIGDVHLGTRPSSLPDDLSDLGVSPSDLTPEAALSTAVDLAIAEQVEAVLFAGDVVESTNARFEALRPLEAAVKRLSDAGIHVLAVVGNHDVEALPRLASRIEGLTILGIGGKWESHVIEKDGRPVAEIVGWSFPERHVRRSPVAEFLASPMNPKHSGIPRLGLVHGDLDASDSNYGPISRQDLRNAGLDAWLLGHIHKPSLGGSAEIGEQMLYGYLGSLVGLDPGELGAHGPWMIHIDGTGRIRPHQHLISPLRWEYVDVNVEGVVNAEDLGDLLLDAAERSAAEIHVSGHTPAALGLRMRLVGKTRQYGSLSKYVEDKAWADLRRNVGATIVFVNKLINNIEPAENLEAIAKGNDPPALLAQMLLSLARQDEDGLRLIEDARVKLTAQADNTTWSPLKQVRDPKDPLSNEALTTTLKQAGMSALNSLLSQQRADLDESGSST